MTDYIRREAAENIFACGKENWKDYEAAACIAALPASDVREVRRGRWERIEPNDKYDFRCVCSNCRKYWVGADEKYDFHFCPNCKRPATQEDVNRAWERGLNDGVTEAMTILLTVLVDKFDGSPYIRDVWREVQKLSEEVGERRVNVTDLRRVLLDEYEIEVKR